MTTAVALMITFLVMIPVVSLIGWTVWFFWDWNRELKST